MANRKINIAELEFDQIKQNLKTFLQGQDRFSDFDFDGSNMSVLLDVLAYNTHYNAMYTNMALNEAYMDSASRRDSVVSIAKTLGYLPRSASCAKANINFTVSGVSDYPTFLTITKHTPFYGTKDDVRYTFYTNTDVSAQRNANNQYVFTEVDVLEGAPAVARFEYTEQNAFVIPNTMVDLSTIQVRVQSSPSSTLYETYTVMSNLTTVDGTTNTFFIKEIDGGYYQVSFGDGIVGKQLSSGSIINVEYFTCSGELPNNISTLFYGGGTFNGGSVAYIELNGMPVNGGKNPETIEEIRFNAPNCYQAQNRAVTALDYEAIILNKVPSIEAVSVWGGENNVPPVYGKVFISAKTVNGRNLTYNEQQSIINETINKYKTIATVPEFVIPDYLDVELDVVAYYDDSLTTKSPDTIATAITNALLSYNETDLQKFNRILRRSVVARLVENVDPSIISCVPRMKMYRSVTPFYGMEYTYNINIGNPFIPGSVMSSGFYTANNVNLCYIDDDSNGNLLLYTSASGVRTDIKTIGTINYSTGIAVINSLNITSTTSDVFSFMVTPSSADIAGVFNQIVSINSAKLKVNVVADRTTNGRVSLGNKFSFTSSNI